MLKMPAQARKKPLRIIVVMGACAAISSTAFGLPWDVDMADGQATKAYAEEMSPPAPGTVAQPHPLTARGSGLAPDGSLVPNVERGTPEGEALSNPYSSNLELGETMYGAYCTPCHGDGQVLGPVATRGYPAVAILSGPSGRSKDRSDGWLYLTIRNGGGLMPSYGGAMSDQEVWSVVEYLRSMPNSEYTPTPLNPTE